LTLSVQEEFAASVPPVSPKVLAPAVGENVPPQLFVADGVGATTRPDGKVSLKFTPVSPMAFGLVMVKLSDVTAPTGIVTAPNDFTIDGVAATVRDALAELPVPPLVDETAPETLVYTAGGPAVTATLNWQLLLTAIVPPLRLMVVTPKVTVPPQPL
jgi:hypothetical protein